MGAQDGKQEVQNTLLTKEELQKAAKHISFDLGVPFDKAYKFAEEAQEKLYYDRDDLVTRETVVVAADAAHINDPDVPAKLESLDQTSKPFPGERAVNAVVDFVKAQYEKTRS